MNDWRLLLGYRLISAGSWIKPEHWPVGVLGIEIFPGTLMVPEHILDQLRQRV